MRSFLLFLCFFSFGQLDAQPGCTDPQANNYQPAATENDGSCTYAPTAYAPGQVANLPPDLEECSGLAWFGSRLWTHEDGGNGDVLYAIDTLTGAKIQTLTLPNTDNTDWEDLAENDEYLFIGDFGNNGGDRTDLRIYRIKKTDLLAGTAIPTTIDFSFSDQTDFSTANNANDFDCEAFFYWNDSLHLFSKNWLNFKTRHYVLPATPGTHTAQLRDSLNVQGQITAADISETGHAVLLGYNVNTGETFLWLLFDFAGSDVFSGNKRKISTGLALFTSQPEGIVFKNETQGYICSERYSALPQKLLSFDIGQWVNGTTSTHETQAAAGFRILPNPFQSAFSIEFFENTAGPTWLSLLDGNGRAVYKKQIGRVQRGELLNVDFGKNTLPSGIYTLVLERENYLQSAQVLKI
jgi:hypothetical protein